MKVIKMMLSRFKEFIFLVLLSVSLSVPAVDGFGPPYEVPTVTYPTLNIPLTYTPPAFNARPSFSVDDNKLTIPYVLITDYTNPALKFASSVDLELNLEDFTFKLLKFENPKPSLLDISKSDSTFIFRPTFDAETEILRFPIVHVYSKSNKLYFDADVTLALDTDTNNFILLYFSPLPCSFSPFLITCSLY